MRRNILLLAGVVALIFGLLFLLQGLGVIHWPRTSTMLGNQIWVTRGAILALLGAILIGGVRFVPTRADRRRRREP